ncbi:hypothetical protein B4N89_33780 [Embleya scabrispora]|uniref:Maleylpyruvate isomerase family mycothiol-dependent enzyme n=1 Tax=Embleya scabrispora TaxID=159449 RepID=A0A1T3NQS9_9ACTN|nr:maleylpyruvate isomerase family mycothiol-dependent enzyme [Embleya scabrispora]OPC79070.1 hypothetical protein B4N89_33780 [Embleya scabrispora]
MDRLACFRHEVRAFEVAVRRVLGAGEAPCVPSCPEWTVTDLVGHLGAVHRLVTAVVADRLTAIPDHADASVYHLPDERDGWPVPGEGPTPGPLPVGLVDWFADGASALVAAFADTPGETAVWTWSEEQTVDFWLRMQTIEAAVHRWDAENALGPAAPIAAEVAVDAIRQNFEVMAPARREWREAAPGAGEHLRFRRTDGPEAWSVRFDGDVVHLDAPGAADVELAGTASDLMLFLWQRIPADHLTATGDRAVLDRYFTLVPPR